MMVTRVKKTVVAVMLLLVFTTAGSALSLAHDPVPPGFAFSLELGLGLSNRTWQGDGFPLQFGLATEIGRVSSLIQSLAEGTRIVGMVPALRAHSLVYTRVYRPKISLHLLDSILLI
jgi:uncharacterized membrane protein